MQMEFTPVDDALGRRADDWQHPRVFYESCRFAHKEFLIADFEFRI
jgi:hypothetical protein